MTDLPDDVQAAEARVVESRSKVISNLEALSTNVVRPRKAAFIGIGVAVFGLLAFRGVRKARSGRRPTPPSHLPVGAAFSKVVAIAPVALTLFSVISTVLTSRRPPNGAPISAIPPTTALASPIALDSKKNWFSQQWDITKAAAEAWSDDYAPSMGAALSYYTLFSLAPLLIIVIAVAGMLFGQDAAQGEIVAQLRGIMGEGGAAAVEGLLKSAREPAKGIVATIAGTVVLLIGATAIFSELQNSLDRIWKISPPHQVSGVWNLLRTRLLSFGLVLGLGFLLIVSLVVSAVLAAVGKWWGGWFVGWDVVLEILNFFTSLGIFTVLFAMIYKLMPRVKIPWRDVWAGATVTALLFIVGKILIGLYLGKSGLASGFGAAGSLVVLVAWVYYSAQIFLFGAEYTWVYSKQHGSQSVKLGVA